MQFRLKQRGIYLVSQQGFESVCFDSVVVVLVGVFVAMCEELERASHSLPVC